MALPVASPRSDLFTSERAKGFRYNLNFLLTDLVECRPRRFATLEQTAEVFKNKITEYEMLPYADSAGDDFNNFNIRDFDALSPASDLKYRFFNGPFYENGPTLLQRAVFEALDLNGPFKDTFALEIINRLLDCRFVDPGFLSPDRLKAVFNDEEDAPKTSVVEYIRSDAFMEDTYNEDDWLQLASRIERMLGEAGDDLRVII